MRYLLELQPEVLPKKEYSVSPCSLQNCFTDILLRCCAAIRSAHSSAFGLAGFCSMRVSPVTPQCSTARHFRNRFTRRLPLWAICV